MVKKSILIVENLERDLRNSRIPLGDFLSANGYRVEYACPSKNSKNIHDLPILRNTLSINLIRKGIRKLLAVEKKHEIDIILSFRLVPNILNYLNSFIRRDKIRILVITGLGVIFTESNKTIKKRFIRNIIKWFYYIASKRIVLVSHNRDDLKYLHVNNGHVVQGSGVSPVRSNLNLEIKGLSLLYAGRLLKSKGVMKAFNIFQKLRKSQSNVTLTIAGEIDPQNPDSITLEDLKIIKNTSGVKFLGFLEDLNQAYSSCNVLLFLSQYREGVSRVIIEALKYGLTIITYDMPGCKDTINNNGLMINPKLKNEMHAVIHYLQSLNKEVIKSNSLNSNKLFEEKFSNEKIYPEYLKVIYKYSNN